LKKIAQLYKGEDKPVGIGTAGTAEPYHFFRIIMLLYLYYRTYNMQLTIQKQANKFHAS